jgi:hypothetical protein
LKDTNDLNQGFIEEEYDTATEKKLDVDNINIINEINEVNQHELHDENVKMIDAENSDSPSLVKSEYLLNLSKKESEAHLKSKISFQKLNYEQMKSKVTELHSKYKEMVVVSNKLMSRNKKKKNKKNKNNGGRTLKPVITN